MWPWEHAAAAYLLYSAASRWLWGRPPSTRAAVVVGFASLLPDLVDKPLAWWLAVLPSGRSLGHSLLVAVPVVAVALAAGRARGDSRASVAFAVGYLSHLAGDVAYPLVVDGELRAGFLLWPVIPAPDGGTTSALPHLQDLVGAFVRFLGTPRGALYLLADAALVAAAVAVWVADGTPGLRWLRPSPPEPARERG
ncbi:metal-dependent hydrolase [Halobacterium litoreum]|uniref:Metal-dependent hydrolase n=1 Tax=Halobacterium litoreum TaxID=2039234 RepID=A0ABD5NAY7_9EURY|nr:metal-dependent hydrolase [Halobacterium litoreum]UHH14672.1 metal-dependent hydrolase [Halobacterium litoreum]